ncbi:unnamed protein product [Diatraea saccharalis]|uniref:C2H2-type domain-containing protein n=1 Tax=Diatraea saccharalis TaxID=40085 RepID=A0A9N9WGB7_9NEOP|nr:unnamed protein product [Diatraea saccharalis]
MIFIIRSTCLICDADVSPDKLKAHLQDHQNALKTPKNPSEKLTVAKVPCDQCGASFVNILKQQAHVKRMHLGLKYNKNIVCEVCGKKCTSNAGLKYHQRTHTGERPYSCASCNKRFKDKNQLRIHARAHTGERPYACALCGKRFSQKPALNRHYRVSGYRFFCNRFLFSLPVFLTGLLLFIYLFTLYCIK